MAFGLEDRCIGILDACSLKLKKGLRWYDVEAHLRRPPLHSHLPVNGSHSTHTPPRLNARAGVWPDKLSTPAG